MKNVSFIDPYAADEQQVQQQLRYAKALQEQALQTDQGQMVSGHYVPPSITQGLAKLFQGYQSKNMYADALKTQQGVTDKRAQSYAKALQTFVETGDPRSLLGDPQTAGAGVSGIMSERQAKNAAQIAADQRSADQRWRAEEARAGREFTAGENDENRAAAMARAEFTAKNGGAAAQPYYQFLPTEGGYAAGNARTGAVDMVMGPDGKPLIRATDSPDLQGAIAGAKAVESTTGKATGAAGAELADREAAMPRLLEVATELSDLGKKATYTKVGQAWDSVKRQAGSDVGEGAIARTEYLSKIDNEVLPLLRQTFGAQFTQKEGESLKVTLGDPDKSPEEKDAVLKSFIESKMAQIASAQRRVGSQVPAPPAYAGPNRRAPPSTEGWSISPAP